MINAPPFVGRRPFQVIILAFVMILILTLVPIQNVYTPIPTKINTESAESVIKTSDKNVITYPEEKSITIVTGASANHFCPLKAFIYNMNSTLNGLNTRMIVYDLGMTHIQRKELIELKNKGYFTEFRTFKFSAYPSFWNISVARGEYGWKPAIVAEVSGDFPGIVTWLDAGTLATRKYFDELPNLLKKYRGFISPRSSGYMKDWTHPGVYEYYNDDHSPYDAIPNCNGAAITFDTTKTQHIIDEWYDCALNKECIAPTGSSRRNHRQDQAILTYLAAREEHYCYKSKENFWIYTHKDHNCKTIITYYEKLNRIKHH